MATGFPLGKRSRETTISKDFTVEKRRRKKDTGEFITTEQVLDPSTLVLDASRDVDAILAKQPLNLYNFTLELGVLLDGYISLRISAPFQMRYKQKILERIKQVGGRDLNAFFHAVGVELRTLADMKGTNNTA